MAILSFWSEDKKQSGQTLSIVAVATYMSVEHNYKTLVVDATFNDDTMERCFWVKNSGRDIKRALNQGKLDIASGTEGLMSAIASNKTTPEIISNYTKVVFKNRLDILLGLKTKSITEYEKNLELYTELLAAANKYYDLVIVDLSKTSKRESVTKILKMSDVIMYTMSQNLKQIDTYIESKKKNVELSKKMIPILTNVDYSCKYNTKNVATYIKAKELAQIMHNPVFLESASEAQVAKFFLNTRLSKKALDQNSQFINSVASTSQKIIHKFEEIKYGKVLHS